MTAQTQGLVGNMPDEKYHEHPAVSKSMLDWVHKSPALLEWWKNAPVDEEVEKAVDFGSAFEAFLLEPDRWDEQYVIAPDVDRRTKAGKGSYQAFLAESTDKHTITSAEYHKIRLMAESVYAHPMARRLLEAEPMMQASYFWTDTETGEPCRCRPDLLIPKAVGVPLVADLKVSADMRTFRTNAARFRYHVQDAFYSDGLTEYYNGTQPNFCFIVVFSSHSAGRYECHVFEFDATDKVQGEAEYRKDLEKYSECKRHNDWIHLEELRLPGWARTDFSQ